MNYVHTVWQHREHSTNDRLTSIACAVEPVAIDTRSHKLQWPCMACALHLPRSAQPLSDMLWNYIAVMQAVVVPCCVDIALLRQDCNSVPPAVMMQVAVTNVILTMSSAQCRGVSCRRSYEVRSAGIKVWSAACSGSICFTSDDTWSRAMGSGLIAALGRREVHAVMRCASCHAKHLFQICTDGR